MQSSNRATPFRSVAVLLALAVSLPCLASTAAAEQDEAGGLSKLSASTASRRRPLVIRNPGAYTLTRNLKAGGGVAIEIASNDVTLDLAGHSVVGPGGRQGVAISIANVANVKVTNGQVQNYGIGVRVVNSTNVTISDLQIDGQDSGGAPPDVEIGVLILDSRGVVARDNVITNTFLGLFVRGDASSGNHLADNLITGGNNGELAICYNPAPGATSGGPSGDLISGNIVSRFRRAVSFSADSVSNVLRGNTLAYFDLGAVEATAGSNVFADNDEVQMTR